MRALGRKASVACAVMALGMGPAMAADVPAALPSPRVVHSDGHPILAEGDYYSADPAPLVTNDKLYILTGHDTAPVNVNDFIMPDWQVLVTADPASHEWLHYPAALRPAQIFKWAEADRAYAGQIVKGGDRRYYLYAPVMERDSPAQDRFAIGVAVADSPLGPWHDAHPAGPIISQRVPEANTIQNIDPTVMVDDDGRVYIYWGTFGQLRGMELAADMITPNGPEVPMHGLTGFFEAPWLMRRGATYYLLYAANHAGRGSDCTEAVYYACQAYATASSPMGPWAYRGVFLKPVSSTTSHVGAVPFHGQWYLAYHTADATGGGHFRRSVALDRMEFDDSVSPPAIRLVHPTPPARPAPAPTRNLAMGATVAASNWPVPRQYWLGALNDGKIRGAPLPPDMWGTWVGAANPAHPWIEYRWTEPVRLNGTRIQFFADQPAGSGEGVPPPRRWHIEYWDGGWKPVRAITPYPTAPDVMHSVRFAAVQTRCLRAVFDAAKAGGKTGGVAVQEWEALAPEARAPTFPPTGQAPTCQR